MVKLKQCLHLVRVNRLSKKKTVIKSLSLGCLCAVQKRLCACAENSTTVKVYCLHFDFHSKMFTLYTYEV